MKLIVPYVEGRLHPLVLPVLRSDGLQPQAERLLDDYDYGRLMARLWREFQTVFVVEQDILPWPGALRELQQCSCEWGTYSYHYFGGIGISHMLGCCKLTDRLMSRLPQLWDWGCHWAYVDRRLFSEARAAGIEPHLHRPPVIHLSGDHYAQGIESRES